MQTSTLSPTSASSPTLIVTPFPKAFSDRNPPPLLRLHPPTANGFLQPHRNNLPRRPYKKKRPPSCSSSSPSIPVAEPLSEPSQGIPSLTWSQQEIGHGSGIYVALSCEELPINPGPDIKSNQPPLLDISPPTSPPDSSSIEEERPTSDDNAPLDTSPHPAPYTLHPDLAEFTAVIQIYNNEAGHHPPKVSTKPIHEIPTSAHSRDDGTPNLTREQFTDACAFLHPFIRPSPASSRHSNGSHPRQAVSKTPAPSQKVLILSPRSHAPDALSLAVGLVCHYSLRLEHLVSTGSEGEEDALLQEMEAVAPEDDRVTAVHALFMRLHDYDDDEGQGLRDEWRGAVSRYGMDIIGSWVCQH